MGYLFQRFTGSHLTPAELEERGWVRFEVERSATGRRTSLVAVKPNRRHAVLTVSDSFLEDNPDVTVDDLLDVLGRQPDVDSYRENP